MISLRFWIIALTTLIATQSCSQSSLQVYLKSVKRPEKAHSFFIELDRTVKKYQLQNVAYTKIAGFPYLRSDRFLAEMKTRLDSDRKKIDWVAYLRARDLEARRSEVSALPFKEVARLFQKLDLVDPPSHTKLMEYTSRYSESLYQYDMNQPGFIEAFVESVKIPDDYSTAMRTFGLYPVAYLPIAYFSDKAFDKFRRWHQLPLEAFKNQGELVSYSVDATRQKPTFKLSSLLTQSNLNSFGLPRLTTDDIKEIAYSFAPVILQDAAAGYDHIGKFVWKDSQPKLNLDSPTVYYYLTYGLLQDKPIIQINYAFWYKAREGELAPWFERGKFDGITIRVSFDTVGEPFMVDIMNNCGCYHFFIPSAATIQKVKELDFELDPLVPKWLPNLSLSSSLTVRVNSGWHQIEHLTAATLPDQATYYQLLPYENLEALKTGKENTKNLFDEEGIMKDSYRIEPYIFFSMGIPKVGYMRQRGHHPIKMLGREHFDNPHLFNRNFTFK